MSSPTYFKLPDFYSMFPALPASASLHYEKAGAESLAWLDSFNVLSPRMRQGIAYSRIDLFVAYMMPYTNFEELRTCIDYCSFIFALDDITDDQDAADARNTTTSMIDAFAGKCCDGSIISRMADHCRTRFLGKMKPDSGAMQRLIDNNTKFVDAVCHEAALRERGEVLSKEEYRVFRRDNSGFRLTFNLLEYCLGLDLPAYVFDDLTVIQMLNGALDMFSLINDLCSYNREQAKDGENCTNIISVLMKESKLSLQETIDTVAREIHALAKDFAADKKTLHFENVEVDKDVLLFIEGLETQIVGYIRWCFACKRYFGEEHEEITRTLVVKLAESRKA